MKRCHCALTVDRRTLQKGTHTQKQMVNAQPPAVKQNNEQLHSNQSVQGGTLHMGSICRKVHQLPQNTHSEGQYSSGAMERYMRGFNLAPELTPYCHNTPQNNEHTSGAMEEISRQGQKVSAP